MTLSNTISFAVTRDQLITDALIDVGAISLGQSVDADLMAMAARKLNMMLKAWCADGLQLWKMRESTLFLQKGQNYYRLGPSGDHFTTDRPIYKSTTTTSHAVAATTINVTTTAAQTNPIFSALHAGDIVGIELSDHTMQWTTVSTVPGGGLTFTIPAPGLTGASGNGATVYAYTNQGVRPLAAWDMMRRDRVDNDIPIMTISRNEYYTFGKKTTTGTPTNFYFNPSIVTGTGNTLTNNVPGSQHAELFTYVSPALGTDRLVFNAQYQIMDMTSANLDFDMPQEWYLGVQTNLAVLLGPAQGASMEQFNILRSIAKEEKDRVMSWDRENTSMYLSPTRRFQGE